MTSMKFILLPLTLSALALTMLAQVVDSADSLTTSTITLDDAIVTARKASVKYDTNALENTMEVSDQGLRRAACCNLGDSFVQTAAVDVNYADAATGAKQIKLLGLSGSYVQMLTESLPSFRIEATPFGMSYIPGQWMQSIAISKGITSVKQGYEAITGQINVEYKKPQQPSPDRLLLNLYTNTGGCIDFNACTTLFMPNSRWGTTLLANVHRDVVQHDKNDDGFADMPRISTTHLFNRWFFGGDHDRFQIGVNYLAEERRSGQRGHHIHTANPYLIDLNTKRVEAFVKNAVFFDAAHESNVALMGNYAYHEQDALYGLRTYDTDHHEAHAALMFETNWEQVHALSVGLSFHYDHIARATLLDLPAQTNSSEAVVGAYAQYTYNLHDHFLVQPGLRIDHSDLWGTFLTPRLHVKWQPSATFTLRASAGKGYRTAFVADENQYLLASHRGITVESPDGTLREEAWNCGVNLVAKIPLGEQRMTLAADYYYTDFQQQAVRDALADPYNVVFYALNGKSRSHVAQVEVTLPIITRLTATMAYRYTDVKTSYRDRGTHTPAITPRHKGLFTLAYATRMNIWEFDATLALYGGGYTEGFRRGEAMQWHAYRDAYKAFPTLQAQVTRNFRHFAIYAGGENLTNFKQKHPIISAQDPWSEDFDATQIWGPIEGWKLYIGFRYTLPR